MLVSGRTVMPGDFMFEQEVADALVLRRICVRARQQHHSLRAVRAGRPDLLAVDDVVVAVLHRARLQRRQVGPGPRLAETLAPEVVAGQDARQVLALLLLRPVDDDRRPGEPDRQEVRPRRRGARHLLVKDELLHHREPGAAVRLRPRGRHPAALRQRPQPVALPLVLADTDAEDRVVGRSQIGRQLIPEEVSYFLPERGILGAVSKFHYCLGSPNPRCAMMFRWISVVPPAIAVPTLARTTSRSGRAASPTDLRPTARRRGP